MAKMGPPTTPKINQVAGLDLSRERESALVLCVNIQS
jgi:hypothetical protein